jgi:hypothetical protein
MRHCCALQMAAAACREEKQIKCLLETICEINNYNNYYDELAYPFSKIIKLKHDTEEAQENIPVQYTSDIIVEIKN